MKMRSLELSLWLSSAAESVAAGGVAVDDILAKTHKGRASFPCPDRKGRDLPVCRYASVYGDARRGGVEEVWEVEGQGPEDKVRTNGRQREKTRAATEKGVETRP